MRQLLSDKISGNLTGIWLLIPEHLRLGTWDLLKGWSRSSDEKPVCFALRSSSVSVSQATPEVVQMGTEILMPQPDGALVMADSEHYTVEIVEHLHQETSFDFFVPMPKQRYILRTVDQIPEEKFVHRWAGLATAKVPYRLSNSSMGPFYLIVQRCGESPEDYEFMPFLATADRDELEDLIENYPDRWHVEEFFNTDQALGWDRAGSLNLNIRYGHMTMALLAQASLHELRKKFGAPEATWNAEHFAREILKGLEGDTRVKEDTIIVTYYNAPNPDRLKQTCEGLPEKLQNQNVDPRVPWLFNFKLDFVFK